MKSFSVLVRRQRLERHTLGRYPKLPLAEARRRAMQLLRELAEIGPVDSTKPAAPAAPTLAALVDSYVELHLKRNTRSWKNGQSTLKQAALNGLAERDATTIAKREIIEVLDALVAAGTPHAGVNLLKNLKALYNWAVDRDLVTLNPCDRIRPPVKTTERDRVLSDDELARVWKATGELPQPWSAMIRMMMLTGQRRCEVSNMRWEEIEADLWVIPRERVKKDRPHVVPLAPQALATLAPLLRPHSGKGYVFSADGGATASSNFNKIKVLLDNLSGTEGWVLHDLRRTLRSGLAAMGVPREVARAVVNHADGKIDRIYNRHEYLAEKREALNKWQNHLQLLPIRHGLTP